MDLTIISTYRCNSKCRMCNVWQNPTRPGEEISLSTLSKLPSGFDNLNISGGEPTLRKDLKELVDIVYPKARVTEISSNGLHHAALIPIVEKYPDIKIRFSLEGDELANNDIRGEIDGFRVKVEGLKELKKAGGRDLGFAAVIQDTNASKLVWLFEMALALDVELATSTLHNAWQFHKTDNYFQDQLRVAYEVEQLIVALLKTGSIKNWFRAYLNLGLVKKILGQDRLIKCTAGKDFLFIDPHSDVWACNVRSDMKMGNLNEQTWAEILKGPAHRDCLKKVGSCKENCWMVTTARTAMRNPVLPMLPKIQPLLWVLTNKTRTILGHTIDFSRYIDHNDVRNECGATKSAVKDPIKDGEYCNQA